MKYLYTSLFIACIQLIGTTQDSSWYREFDSPTLELAKKIAPLPNGDMVILLEVYNIPIETGVTRLAKISTSGELLWEETVTEQADGSIQDIAVANDGQFMLVGNAFDSVSQKHTIVLQKVDSTGSLSWTKLIENFSDVYASSIIATEDGGFLIGGSIEIESITPFNERYNDYYIFKIDTAGLIEWTAINSKIGMEEELGTVVELEEKDDIYYAFVNHNTKHGEISVVRLNQKGELIDQRYLARLEEPVRAFLTNDNNYLLYSYSDQFFLNKLDTEGNSIWEKTYQPKSDSHSSDNFHVINGIDGGYLLIRGGFKSTATQGNLHLTKITEASDIIWERSIATPGIPVVRDVAVSADDHYLMTGLADVILTGLENENYFVLKLGKYGLIESDSVYSVEVISQIASTSVDSIQVYPNPATATILLNSLK